MLAVIFGHSRLVLDPQASTMPLGLIDPVTAFFVLSGFLIGRMLIRSLEAAPTLRTLMAFLMLRWLRTLPAYFGALALIGLAWTVLVRQPLPAGWSGFLWFGQNLAWPHPGVFGEAWSLSVEEWFYLTAPAAILLLVRLARCSVRQAVPVLAITVIACTCLLRTWALNSGDIPNLATWDAQLRKVVVMRLDSIMWGMLAAWVWVCRPAGARRWAPAGSVAGCAALVLISCIPHVDPRSVTWIALVLTPIAIALALPFATTIRTGPAWLSRPATLLSRMSYSLYLVHGFLVVDLLLPWLVVQYPVKLQSVAARYGLYWVLTAMLGWLLWRFVEHPAMQLGQALMARRTPPVAPRSTVEARTVPA